MIDLDKLLSDFRSACRCAGIDPSEGAQSVYETTRAIACLTAKRRQRDMTWALCDWSHPGQCRSDTEYETFFALFVSAWRIQIDAMPKPEPTPIRAYEPLRKRMHRQGLNIVWIATEVDPDNPTPFVVALDNET